MRTPFFIRCGLCLVAGLWACPFTQAQQTDYTSLVIQDAPLFYWNFDGQDPGATQLMPIGGWLPTITTENDLLPTGNVGRASHASLSSGLRLGNAATFDGASYLKSPAPFRTPVTELSGAYAIELWVQSQASNEGTYPLNFGAIPGGDNAPAVIYNFGGWAGIEIFAGGGGRTGTAGPEFADSGWHHILAVYYGNGSDGVAARTDIYFDGAVYSGLNPVSRRLSLANLMVGAGLPAAGGAGIANAFTGNIDEVAIYDLQGLGLADEAAVEAWAELLAADHRASAAAASGPSYSSVVLADSPLLYWNFDEETPEARQAAPINVNAIVGDNRLTPRGNPIQIPHEEIASGLSLGRAAQLDGSSFYTARPLHSGIENHAHMTGAYAIELWFQSLGSNSGTYPLNFGDFLTGGDNAPAVLYNFGGYENRIEFLGRDSWARTGLQGPLLTDQDWHHLMMVYYGNGVDGVANRFDIYLDKIPYTSIGPVSQRLSFGGLVAGAALLNGANAFTGHIDELALYDLSSLPNEAAVTAKVTGMVNSHFAAAGAAPPTAEVTISTQPVSVTANIGESASFQVTASATGTDEPLTYQWYRDGKPLPSATEASLTFPEITLFDVGIHPIRVKVSAGLAFAESAEVTLTVAAPPTPAATPYTQQVLADSPLLYWNFDESTGPAVQRVSPDPAGAANDLALHGVAGRLQHSGLGSGLNLGHTAAFTGGGGHFRALLSAPSASLSGPFGIELWFQSLAPNGGSYLANFGNHTAAGGDNAPAVIYNFGVAPQQLELFRGFRTGTSGPFVGDDNQDWHHVMFAYYGNGSVGVAPLLEIYYDGEVYPVATSDPWSLDLAGLVVGAALPSGVNTFTGNIDEFAIYDFSNFADEATLRGHVESMVSRHRAAATATGGVAPSISISHSGGSLTLTWTAPAGHFLQESTNLRDWTTLAAATSPHITPAPATGPKFYRLAKMP